MPGQVRAAKRTARARRARAAVTVFASIAGHGSLPGALLGQIAVFIVLLTREPDMHRLPQAKRAGIWMSIAPPPGGQSSPGRARSPG